VYFDFNNGAKNKTKKQIVTSVQFSFRHSNFARMFVSFINVCIFLFFSFFLWIEVKHWRREGRTWVKWRIPSSDAALSSLLGPTSILLSFFLSFYTKHRCSFSSFHINSSLITTEATILRTSPYLSCSFFFFNITFFFFFHFFLSLKTPAIFFFFSSILHWKKNPTSHFRKPRKKILL